MSARVYSLLGTGGSSFVLWYGATFAVLLGAAGVMRYQAVTGRRVDRRRVPDAAQSAFIVGGRAHAVCASLAALRLAGAIDIRSDRALVAVGPAAPGMSGLDAAVYGASVRQQAINEVVIDRHVAGALDEIEVAARRAGWVLTGAERWRAGSGAWLLLTFALVGVARACVAFLQGDAALGLPVLAIVAGVTAWVFRGSPRVSRAGERAIADRRRIHGYLAPSQRPSWTTYGFRGMAWGVALFGTRALWSADPMFATNAGIARPAGFDSGGFMSLAGEFTGCGSGCAADRTCGGGSEGCGD